MSEVTAADRDEVLRRIALGEDAPALPAAVLDVLDYVQGPLADPVQAAALISGDAGLARRAVAVLTRAGDVPSVEDAAVRAGAESFAMTALGVGLTDAFPRVATHDFDYAARWEDAIRTSCAARALAENARGLEQRGEERVSQRSDELALDPAVAAAAALGLGLGELVLARLALPGKGSGAGEGALDPGEAGEALAVRWALPAAMIAAIRYHRDPTARSIADEHRPLVSACALAHELAALHRRPSSASASAIDGLRLRAGTALGVAAEAFDEMLDGLAARVERLAAALGIEVPEQRSLLDVIAEASRRPSGDELAVDELRTQYALALERETALREQLDDAQRAVDALNAKLAQLTNTDPLTGIYNRRYFHECYRRELARSQRYDVPVSVVMIDLDHFREVNEAHGHVAGDLVLQHVAGVLADRVRSSDLLARYGGQLFVALLSQTDATGGKIFGERAREAIEETRVLLPTGDTVTLTASVGGCTFPLEGTPEVLADDALRIADAALYRSKREGRNRLTWAQ